MVLTFKMNAISASSSQPDKKWSCVKLNNVKDFQIKKIHKLFKSFDCVENKDYFITHRLATP